MAETTGMVIVLEVSTVGGANLTTSHATQVTRMLQAWLDCGTAMEAIADALGSVARVHSARVLR